MAAAVRIHCFCDMMQCHLVSGSQHVKILQCLCMAKNTHLVTASHHTRPESPILNVVFQCNCKFCVQMALRKEISYKLLN
jgi:hypothetical protein